MSRKFSESDKTEMLRLYTEGVSIKDICSALGVSRPHLKTILAQSGLPRRPQGWQIGNPGSRGRPLAKEAREAIRLKHRASGHRPSPEAVRKGQPKALISRWEGKKQSSIRRFMYQYRVGARNRGLEFNLTEEEFSNLIRKDCHYCGEPPTERRLNRCHMFTCNGIDRIDSRKDYSADNCRPACKRCNIMKSDMGDEAFIEHCRKVARKWVT